MDDDRMNGGHAGETDGGPLEPAEAALRDALRAEYGIPPGDVSWDELESRIVGAARLRLAARAPRRGWRAPATRWAHKAIPAAIAATLLLAVGLTLDPAEEAVADPAMSEVIATAAGEGLPSDPLAVTDQEAFLQSVLDATEAP